MQTDQEIIDDVRFITGYPEIAVDDGKIQSALDFTKGEIRGICRDEDLQFESYAAGRALMWGTCYHLKINVGEIGGLPISIGDIDLSRMNRARGDPNGDILKWAEKFWDNVYRMEKGPKKMGSTNGMRENRIYGEESEVDGPVQDGDIE